MKEGQPIAETEPTEPITRRQLLKFVGLTTISLALPSACTSPPPAEEPTQTPGETPAATVTLTPPALTATPAPLTAPVKATPAPSATLSSTATATEKPPAKSVELPYAKSDQEIAKQLETARGGEELDLENPLIVHVVKLPRPFLADAVYATLGVETLQTNSETGQEEVQTEIVGIIDNFDCEYGELVKRNRLGENLGKDLKKPINSGVWKPQARLSRLKARVYIEGSAGMVTMITSQSFIFKTGDEIIACEKKSVFEGLGDLPKEAARIAGRTIRQIIEGLQEGYSGE